MLLFRTFVLVSSLFVQIFSFNPWDYDSSRPGDHGYYRVHNGLEQAEHIMNEWTVQVDGDEEVAQLIALELGYVYGGPVIGFPNTYTFLKYEHSKQRRTYSDGARALITDRRIRWAEQLFSKSRVKRYPTPDPDESLEREKRIDTSNAPQTEKRQKREVDRPLFNDELWGEEWYLQDSRNVRELPRLDLNVLPVYAMGYTGRGVRVSVLDDGIEHNHTDLRGNYDPDISWDCNDGDPDPTPRFEDLRRNSHGTRCAGEIAMTANNVKCGVGVAWGAKVGGVRMLDGRITDRIEGEGIAYDPEDPEVVSLCQRNTPDKSELSEEENRQLDPQEVENQEPQGEEKQEEELPQDILAALGQEDKDTDLYGGEIYPEIIKIINLILTDGLEKEVYENLKKAIKIPKNAKLLDAPKLNSYAWDKVDIYSASWGPNDDGRTVEGPGRLAIQAFKRGVTEGRGGKGVIYVWANGNGGSHSDNCNCDGYSSSIYTVSIGSASQHGLFPWYGEVCSSTLAVAYSSGAHKDQKIATTDTNDSCTLGHTGTSAAAPLAAGIIALALEANSNLTWRDVQHLIVWTSESNTLAGNPGWINDVGLRFDVRFGFGLLNAEALVSRALNWVTVPDKHVCHIAPSQNTNQKIISSEQQVTVHFSAYNCAVNYVEHVELVINARYSKRGALEVYLASPRGTKVQLLSARSEDVSSAGFSNWPLMSVATWGENPKGLWTAVILDDTDGANSGEVGKLTLVIHGTSETPAHMKLRKEHVDENVVNIDPDVVSNNNFLGVVPEDHDTEDEMDVVDPTVLAAVEKELLRIHHRKVNRAPGYGM